MKLLAAFVVLVAISSTQANIVENIIGQITGLFDNHEEPPFDVVRTAPGYEERTYPARKWVCTSTEGSNADVMEPMFWRLFRYIGGHNNSNGKMAMTIPVTTEYLVRGPTDKKFVMCFFLGEAHQANPPTPSETHTYIESRPELTVLTRTVGGYVETEEQWLQEAGQLAALIAQNGETVTLGHEYWAGYDAPLKFWSRRNEVWFPKP